MTWLLTWLLAPVVALAVICWPRPKCGQCGRRVWGWDLMEHINGHIDDDLRAVQ